MMPGDKVNEWKAAKKKTEREYSYLNLNSLCRHDWFQRFQTGVSEIKFFYVGSDNSAGARQTKVIKNWTEGVLYVW